MAASSNTQNQMADLIKMQLFMGDGKDGQAFSKLKSFVLLTLFDVLMGIAKSVFTYIGSFLKTWYDTKVKQKFQSKIDDALSIPGTKIENEIMFERVYENYECKSVAREGSIDRSFDAEREK